MYKKELTSTYLYYGDLSMPKGFEINPKPLIMGTFEQEYLKKRFPYSIELDKVDTYIRDYSIAKHNLSLEGKETWGNLVCTIYRYKHFKICRLGYVVNLSSREMKGCLNDVLKL